MPARISEPNFGPGDRIYRPGRNPDRIGRPTEPDRILLPDRPDNPERKLPGRINPKFDPNRGPDNDRSPARTEMRTGK